MTTLIETGANAIEQRSHELGFGLQEDEALPAGVIECRAPDGDALSTVTWD